MCGRFTVLTHEEIADAVRAVEERGELTPLTRSGGQEAFTDSAGQGALTRAQARPSSTITAFGIDFEPMPLTWGFTFEWHKGPVFNTRIESLLANNPTWREAAREGRCIIPVASFFEPHATETIASPRTGRPMKRPYEFASPDGVALLLAGVASPVCCSIVTTQPNARVSPVHDRMPLALTPSEAADWLDSGLSDAQLFELWNLLADRSRFALTMAPEQLATSQRVRKADDDTQLSLF